MELKRTHSHLPKPKEKMIHKTLLFHCLFIFFAAASSTTNDEPKKGPLICSKVGKEFGRNLIVPPYTDPETGVQSKDIKIVPKTGLSGRLYIPKTTNPVRKLPLVVYFHGGGFCAHSAFSLKYHKYCSSLVAKANVIILSVEYRLAPEHPLPIAYEDSWAALKWVASHSNGHGDNAWVKDNVNFKQVFFAGDGSGANIAHNMAMRAGSEQLDGVKLAGIVLIHPFLWAEKPLSDKESKGREFIDTQWRFVCPSSSGLEDPRVNPAMDPKLWRLGCTRVLVLVAGKSPMAAGNYGYSGALQKSGWRGVVEVMVAKNMTNGFQLKAEYAKKPEAVAMLKKVASFMNQNKSY